VVVVTGRRLRRRRRRLSMRLKWVARHVVRIRQPLILLRKMSQMETVHLMPHLIPIFCVIFQYLIYI